MPLPSTACQTCKSRRIKCDETKPSCKRCQRSNRLCLSSAAFKQASFSIHVENLYASGSAKRPRGPRSGLTNTRPRIDVQTCALAYYLQYHMQALTDAPNVSGCLSECVSAWKASGRTSEMVDLALSSMALAVFSRTSLHREAAEEASLKYHKLLRLSRWWISQVRKVKLDAADIDACLLAVSLMGRYEGVALHIKSSKVLMECFAQLRNWCHHDGAMAVLKTWYDNRTEDTNSASVIIKHTRRGILKSCLMRNRPLPEWLLDGEPFGEHGMELDSDRIDVRILALRDAYVRLEHDMNAETAERLNNDAKEIDDALQALVNQLPESHCYQQHAILSSGSFPKRHFMTPVVYSYQRAGYAASWAQHFAARMLVNRLRLRILDLSCYDSTHEQQRSECHTAINAMAESLASTIPFCLERFSLNEGLAGSIVVTPTTTNISPYLVNSVVWPMSIAAGLEGTNVKHLLWFRGELAALGSLIGDGVIESAGTCEWAII